MTVHIIQDFVPYNESVIWDLTEKYYKENGLDVFSKMEAKDIVPYESTSNYQSAKAYLEMLIASSKDLPESSFPLKLLDCGAGNGYFAYNLLHAAKEMNFLDKIYVIITDFAKENLLGVKKKKILAGFEEFKHYELVELDVSNLETAKSLDDKPYKFENIYAVSMNYLLDLLPLTVLNRKNSMFKEKFDQLQIKTFIESKEDLKDMDFMTYCKALDYEFKWAPYKIEEEPESEKKYYDFFLNYHEKNKTIVGRHLYFPYFSFISIEALMKVVTDDGFLYIADIPPRKYEIFKSFGASISHEIEVEILAAFAADLLGYDSVSLVDDILSRIIICKSNKLKIELKKSFNKVFIEENMVNRLADIRLALGSFHHKEASDIFLTLLDEFEKLAGPSSEVALRRGYYHRINGDFKKAKEYYEKAKKLDFINDYDIDAILWKLEHEQKDPELTVF